MRRRKVCVADLAPLALDLALWGTQANAPALAGRAAGRDARQRRPICCAGSGALDDAGKVTAHGRAMQEFPVASRDWRTCC
jgi:ATP-dependent helicase HrpB